MAGILLSLNFIWIALVILAVSITVAYLCIYLRRRLLYIPVAEWLTEHIFCPLSRVFLLLLIAFLLFPLMFESTRYSQLFEVFFQMDLLIDLLNILLFSSLLFTFLPVLNHSAIGMPLLACIATALLYLHHVVLPANIEFNAFPTGSAFGKIVVVMILIYWLSRWLNKTVSEWIDLRFMVTDSKNLLVEINYLIFQVPVVLVYGQSLRLQNAA